jgi:hypothetical protein
MNVKKVFTYFVIIIAVLEILSCGSFKTIKPLQDQEFISNSEKFFIISPLNPGPSQSNKFTIKDTSNNIIFEDEINVENPQNDKDIFDKERTENGVEIKSANTSYYKFFVAKPFSKDNYRIDGEIHLLQDKERGHKESSRTNMFLFPIKFWVSEYSNNVGEITIPKPDFSFSSVQTMEVNTEMHGKKLKMKYQSDLSNDESCSIFDGQELLGYIYSKTKEGISYNRNAEFLIRQNIPDELKSDVIASYIITEIVRSISANGNE